MSLAAKLLRQSNRESLLMRGKSPGNRFSVAKIFTNLGSRPGASFRPSMARQYSRLRIPRREQAMRAQLTEAAQRKAVVL